ncbi:Protein of uncharacterised function (DUF3100) [Delftia tsuruhatensis]|uniref:DUF3100 domain-containing protein n=1 Tax=Delftia tsuruhatensis TaxID=180282 RepID=UPI001E78A324|nr:DUF3100 domain-containing protein [Delftia tsuruhatensis]CAB5704165.1 Protein of uncharacterised function (DUF3100) [Delftia tsuruhatensis]CAC9684195.1 Protein of uncharacterised function (DUF3100) [Delftia tsuruhatensis]
MGIPAENAGLPSLPTRLRLFVVAAAIVLVAELIGTFRLPLGPGKVVLLPMIWALLLGTALGMIGARGRGLQRLDVKTQFYAAAILQPALLLFVAKLGLMVGTALPEIAKAGWALAFQELGHFVGTIVLGLPLALLLGIKREAIGATFSVGREPSLAIIGEKYGLNSPEGRGVMAEYLTGTIFGSVFIAVFAGYVASLGIFHPLALAMGAGMGSGSMMAAAAGAIAAQQAPEMAKSVMTFAAASNLLTTTIGTYFTLFLSLPMAVWGYRLLEPLIGRNRKNAAPPAETPSTAVRDTVPEAIPRLGFRGKLVAWGLTALLAMACDWMSRGASPLQALPGMAILLGATLAGELLCALTRRKIPAVCTVSVVAMFMVSPLSPWAAQVTELSSFNSFLGFTTPMLAFAGLSIAKDIPAFRQLGWRIVLVSFAANAGTFLGAAMIAQAFHI